MTKLKRLMYRQLGHDVDLPRGRGTIKGKQRYIKERPVEPETLEDLLSGPYFLPECERTYVEGRFSIIHS